MTHHSFLHPRGAAGAAKGHPVDCDLPLVSREAREASPAAAPPAPAPSLRVDSDVPGTHRLSVSAERYEMYAESVDFAPGPNQVMVRFKEVRLDERVAVTHKHGVGSCRGVLHATTAGLRFKADKPGDSFEAPLASLEPLQIDYTAKNLRVKQKAGKTWNFTSDSADALLVFQKKVEAARARL